MKRLLKSVIVALMIVLISVPAQAATKKQITSNTKTITVVAGSTYILKVKDTKATWKPVKNAHIVLTKKGNLTVKKAGRIKIKYVSNKKTKSISVIIRKKKSNSNISDDDITEDPLVNQDTNRSENPDDSGTPVVSVDDSDPSGPSSNNEVWLSATGIKYHKINNCGTMNPSKARKVTLAYARSHGFTPCSKCF